MDANDYQILDRGVINAKSSPCLRRGYCAQIYSPIQLESMGINLRFSDCCGSTCIRDVSNAPHGQMVERGGEIHAEQYALIKFNRHEELGYRFYLSGWDFVKDEELWGRNVLPCHTCAIMIKAAGFHTVVLKWGLEQAYDLSIEYIIALREAEWNPTISIFSESSKDTNTLQVPQSPLKTYQNSPELVEKQG